MMMFNEDKPIVVLTTSAACPHCEKYRGPTGIPGLNGSDFTINYLKSLLRNSRNSRLNFIVEIHVADNSNRSDILELNFYTMISPQRLSEKINSRIVLTEDNIGFGNGSSLCRISFKRNGFVKVLIEYSDGFVDSPSLTNFLMEYYVWNRIDDKIKQLRNDIRNHGEFNRELALEIEDASLKRQVFDPTQYRKYCDDPNAFDNFLLNYVLNIGNEFMSNLIPLQIRDYEVSYPSWYLISTSWWIRGLQDKDLSIFLKKASGTTELVNGRYSVSSFAREKIHNVLEMYEARQLSLDNISTRKDYWGRKV